MWCFENNVYYEGQILRHVKNWSGRNIAMNDCKNSCVDDGDKCTAFVYRYYKDRATNSRRRNCTLMMNVTHTIARKTQSIMLELLISGKKCKYYDPLRKKEEEGMNYPFLQLLNLAFIYITYVLCLG